MSIGPSRSCLVHNLLSPTAWVVCEGYKNRSDLVSEFLHVVSQQEVWAIVNGEKERAEHWSYLAALTRKHDRLKHFISSSLYAPSKYRTIRPKTVITDVLISLNSPKVL